MDPNHRLAPSRVAALPWALLLVACAALALALGWVGYMASDDMLYYSGSIPWLTHPPSAGTDHWSTRFPLTISFAAMLAVVGRNFTAFALTAILYYAILIGVTGRFAARVGGARAGWIAALMTATLPVIVGNASTVSVDLLEAAALVGAIGLLADAGDDRRGTMRALAAGMLFGVAILCRETSVLPLFGLLPLFLLGRPVPRRALIAAGIGCVLVIGAEALFQYAMTGDALRRYTIAFHHDSHIDRAANHEGNLLLWWPIDPVLVLLVNDDFGLLFWLAGVALAAGAARGVPESGRRRLIVLGAMAAASFLLVGALVHKLVLNPRYFTLPALAAVVLVACWTARMRARTRALVLVAFVGSNLLLLSASNRHPHWPMDSMLIATTQYPRETVSGAAQDVRRNALALSLEGRANRLRPGPAQPGGLELVPADAVPPGRVVARYVAPPVPAGAVVQGLGLAPLLPGFVARRLLHPVPDTVLVRRAG